MYTPRRRVRLVWRVLAVVAIQFCLLCASATLSVLLELPAVTGLPVLFFFPLLGLVMSFTARYWSQAAETMVFIVMAIMGGAILPKLMGAVADNYGMSRGFIVPLACFVGVALYGYIWPKLSKAESLNGVRPAGGH